jgi:GGDEF-like domain
VASERQADHPPRARACGDLPLERLLERAEELTRRWAIALIAERSVEGLGALPLAELAGGGPALCRGLMRALCADGELALLLDGDTASAQPGDARTTSATIVALSGARDGRALSEAVEALRGAAWELLLEEVSGPLAYSPRALAEVGDRLAHVCSRLLGEALADVALGAEPGPRGSASSPGFPVRPVRSTGPRAPGRVVILDERVEDVEPERGRARESSSGAAPGGPPSRESSFDEPQLSAHRLATVPVLSEDVDAALERAGAAEIEIRDERHEEGPAAWIGSIGRQLERFRADGRAFAVLLVEPLGPRRQDEQASSFERLERTLADELARATGGSLTRERPGRYWLIAPGTDRIAAAQVRERLELALDRDRVAIAVGIAICPEDGESAPALAAHADIGLYAARAEARAAASRDER